MLSYLHDIRNKLSIVTVHTSRLSCKYNDEEFITISTNLNRMNDLINEAYSAYTLANYEELQVFSVREFVYRLDLLLEALLLPTSLEYKNQIGKIEISKTLEVKSNLNLLTQILENIIDNALKANSTKLYVHLIELDKDLVIEIIDNGHGLLAKSESEYKYEETEMPHGIGKKIISENMHKMGGRVEWRPRMDSSGMIVRLSIPLIIAPLV